MITVKYNIDFKKALKELEEKKLSETLNKEVTPKTVELSKKFIKSGNVKPRLSGFQRNYRKSIGINQNKPLFMTGKLVNSLKGTFSFMKDVFEPQIGQPKGLKKKKDLKGHEWIFRVQGATSKCPELTFSC